MKLATISKDIRKENRTKILIKKRKFKKSLFNAKIFRFKLKFFSKCPEIGKSRIYLILKNFNIFEKEIQN